MSVFSEFARTAVAFPSQIAIKNEAKELSYNELVKRSRAGCAVLTENTSIKGLVVAIDVHSTLDFILAMLSVLHAGGVYLPLERSAPKARRVHVVQASRTSLVITDRGPDYIGSGPVVVSHHAIVEADTRLNPGLQDVADDSDDAYIMYTSGSTGSPKGVRIPHRGIKRLVKNTNYIDLNPDKVILQHSSLAFDASTFEIWGALLNGATLALQPPGLMPPESLESLLLNYGITTAFFTTAYFNVISEQHPRLFSCLTDVLFGGEQESASHVRHALAAAPDTSFVHVYGPTENTTFSSFYPVKRTSQSQSRIPIGRAIRSSTIHVVRGDGSPTHTGEVGEILLSGDGLANGYLPADLNRGKFVDVESVSGSVRAYRTGDFGYWNCGGDLVFSHRSDGQIKLSGHRVELGEVKAALEGIDIISQAYVEAALQDSGTKVLYATLICTEQTELRDLLCVVRAVLPSHMVPARFYRCPEFPLNVNGKVCRKRLGRARKRIL